MAVFLVSGLWHGQGLHFVIWGLLNGILLVIGELTDGFRKGLRGKLHIREAAGWLLWIRRLIVFLLFSLAFIFFRAGTVEGALYMLRGIFTIRPWMLAGFYPQQMFEKDNILFGIAMLSVLFFLLVQYLRRGETTREENGFKRQVLIFCGLLRRYGDQHAVYLLCILRSDQIEKVCWICTWNPLYPGSDPRCDLLRHCAVPQRGLLQYLPECNTG